MSVQLIAGSAFDYKMSVIFGKGEKSLEDIELEAKRFPSKLMKKRAVSLRNSLSLYMKRPSVSKYHELTLAPNALVENARWVLDRRDHLVERGFQLPGIAEIREFVEEAASRAVQSSNLPLYPTEIHGYVAQIELDLIGDETSISAAEEFDALCEVASQTMIYFHARSLHLCQGDGVCRRSARSTDGDRALAQMREGTMPISIVLFNTGEFARFGEICLVDIHPPAWMERFLTDCRLAK